MARVQGHRAKAGVRYLDEHIIFAFNTLVTITSGHRSAVNNIDNSHIDRIRWVAGCRTQEGGHSMQGAFLWGHEDAGHVLLCAFSFFDACLILKY